MSAKLCIHVYFIPFLFTLLDYLILSTSRDLSGTMGGLGNQSTPCPAFCECSRTSRDIITEVDCSFNMLQEVPPLPPSNAIRRVNLMGNMLESLHLQFRHLTGIRELLLNFNSINLIRSSTFTSLSHLETLNLDYNNLSSLEAAHSLVRIPNSTVALSISLMFNPIPCTCKLIPLYNSVIEATPNLRHFYLTCLDGDSRKTVSSTQRSSANRNTLAFSSTTQSQTNAHVLINKYAVLHCTEVVLTPKSQLERVQMAKIAVLDILVILTIVVVFLLFTGLVVYYGIYKTCRHMKRRKKLKQRDQIDDRKDPLNHTHSNGHSKSQNDKEDLLREFQITPQVAIPMKRTQSPRPPSTAPLKSLPPLPGGLYSVAMQIDSPNSPPPVLPTLPQNGILKPTTSPDRQKIVKGSVNTFGGFRTPPIEPNSYSHSPKPVGIIPLSPGSHQESPLRTSENEPPQLGVAKPKKSRSFYMQTSV